jgi:hypothetical protein
MLVVNNYSSHDNHSIPTLGITFVNIVVPLGLVRPPTIVYPRLLTHFTATESQGHFYHVRPLFLSNIAGEMLKTHYP